MQPQTLQDYKQLLTDVIKKQIVILGPDITLSKARNVKGITVGNDGTVTEVTGNPQEVIQSLIDQFVQLSGLIVKKTMEPLLAISQAPQIPAPSPTPIQTATAAPIPATEQSTPVSTVAPPTVAIPEQPVPATQPVQPAISQEPIAATPPPAPPAPLQSEPNPVPAKNPLAA